MRLSLLIPAHRHEIFTVATLRERLSELGCEVDLEIGEAGDPDSATGDACLLADGCEPDDWPSLVEAFEAGAQVVYGSRLLGPGKPAGMLWSCYLGHRLRTTLANQLFDLGLSDEAPEVVLIATGLLQSLPA
ncbi:MAG: hypothetical protein KJO07_03240, partial [Deltaproteobacteria bacterium]|nr:hypothetical protein [Deltaproteobacteria bacterium]